MMTKKNENLDNLAILRDPAFNKGTAFTKEERIRLKILGLLPTRVFTMEEQIDRRIALFDETKDEFAKFLLLKDLREQNQVLYFSLLQLYPEKLLPYVYTPMVGEAAIQFSKNYTHTRGLFFSYPEKEFIDLIVDSIPLKEVDVIVITDGSRILGLGDMGAGGMAIPIGKLDLYTVFAGIDPMRVLPVCVDVGTNNETLLSDPYYIGWKHQRITGSAYFEFIDQIIEALKRRYPRLLVQWEDFSKDVARPLLEIYSEKICSFNDDIQGTAASVLVAVKSALVLSKQKLKDQRIVIFGGGSAGMGIADLIVYALKLEGIEESIAKKQLYIIDIHGLILDTDARLDPKQKTFAHSSKECEGMDLDRDGKIGLADIIESAEATILIGVSGQPGAFTKEIVQKMLKNTDQPIILPLSNPTSKSEASPQDLIEWTKGKARLATGSPFPPVVYQGVTYPISQCNNVYVFPGLGLGILAAQAKKVPVDLFIRAADVVSRFAGSAEEGALFPRIRDLRMISRAIGIEVAKTIIENGWHQRGEIDQVEKLVDALIWEPAYQKFE